MIGTFTCALTWKSLYSSNRQQTVWDALLDLDTYVICHLGTVFDVDMQGVKYREASIKINSLSGKPINPNTSVSFILVIIQI